MERKSLLCLCVALAAASWTAGFDASAKSPVRTVVTQRGTQSLASVFQASIGKYPADVKLFDRPAVRARFINLMGQRRFDFMVANFEVQTPIEFSNWNYYTSGCQAHNCGTTDFSISYNPEENNLCVIYRENGYEQIFKEKKGKAHWEY